MNEAVEVRQVHMDRHNDRKIKTKSAMSNIKTNKPQEDLISTVLNRKDRCTAVDTYFNHTESDRIEEVYNSNCIELTDIIIIIQFDSIMEIT